MLNFSVSNAALENSLSGLWQRTGAIAHNIANQDTPGFQARRVSFEDSLAREIDIVRNGRNRGMTRREAIGRVQNVQSTHYRLEGLPHRADGNNVDIINEQIELARVQEQYRAVRQRISAYYSGLENAIRGGR